MSPPNRAGSRGFGSLRIVAFESRQSSETAALIERAGGIAISAPAMQEIPLDQNDEAVAFAQRVVGGEFDITIFLTGIGTKLLFESVVGSVDADALVTALNKTTVVARGPKPAAALQSLGIRPDVRVPEPNTWREVLTELDQAVGVQSLTDRKIAVQEYGETNHELVRALEERGATVTSVRVYQWGLPDDLYPLLEGVRQIIQRTADGVLFTSATQVSNVLNVAEDRGLSDALRQGLSEVAIASIGPVCSRALEAHALAVDFEPTRPKLAICVTEFAEKALDIVLAKRATTRPAVSKVRVVSPEPLENGSSAVEASAFMRACRRQETDYTPVWLMRQAGRYMQEYREVRARMSFLELCKNPEAAAEVTVHAAERLGVDAAIIFSDILLILQPMGLGLEYSRGDGPVISGRVRDQQDVDNLNDIDTKESLGFLLDAIALTRRELAENTPLIGFSGAPFTLASYIIEGGSSRNFIATKRFMYTQSNVWHALLDHIARSVAPYLKAQFEAGCDALQLFDSWVGCLSPHDYETFVLPHTKTALANLPTDVPVIHFGTDTATLLDAQSTVGASVLGIDHKTDLAETMKRFPNLAIQGNLDPALLFSDPPTIEAATRRVLNDAAGRPGHIFNLGHGIMPATPVDHVLRLVDTVHKHSAR